LYIIVDESIKSEEELKEHYPNIYKKLLPFKEKCLKGIYRTIKTGFIGRL
jgi:hypothetical protein